MGTRSAKGSSIGIGITAADREQITKGLSALLADSHTLYLMTHNFHWNVTGPQFNSLHAIAERIRALGHVAPGSCGEFMKLTTIGEVNGVPKTMDMVRHLISAQEATARTARELFPVATAANVQPTSELRSLLEE